MGNFYREKAFHTRKKIRNDFAPSEKYSSYVSAWYYLSWIMLHFSLLCHSDGDISVKSCKQYIPMILSALAYAGFHANGVQNGDIR